MMNAYEIMKKSELHSMDDGYRKFLIGFPSLSHRETATKKDTLTLVVVNAILVNRHIFPQYLGNNILPSFSNSP